MGFLANTRVITSDGIRDIHSISVGQHVLTHENRYRPVIRAIQYLQQFDLVRLTLDPKLQWPSIVTSTDHIFCIRFQGHSYWLHANGLLEDRYEPVLFLDGWPDFQPVDAPTSPLLLHKKQKSSLKKKVLFDLEVEEDSTYTANHYVVRGIFSRDDYDPMTTHAAYVAPLAIPVGRPNDKSEWMDIADKARETESHAGRNGP